MDKIIVGQDPVVGALVDELEEHCPSFHLLCKDWAKLARKLNVPPHVTSKLKLDLMSHRVENNELLIQILDLWVGNNGTDATMDKLGDALIQSGMRSIHDFLLAKYLSPESISNPKSKHPVMPSSISTQSASMQAQNSVKQHPTAQDSAQGNPQGGEDIVDFIENVEPLEVVVRRPDTGIAFEDDHYKLPKGKKGYALVINIIDFGSLTRNRKGAKNDTIYMNRLLTQLGYDVTVHEGKVTFADMQKYLDDFREKFTTSQEGLSCVVFIGSHGSFSRIETSDHESVNLFRHIIYKFDSQRCKELKGKPKVFLIQACQGFRTGVDSESVPNRTEADKMLEAPIDDTIVCFSTTPGFLSNRDLYLGTWFTFCLAKIFMENAHQMDLLKLIKKTQETMRKIDGDAEIGQLATYWDLGIKTLYFNM